MSKPNDLGAQRHGQIGPEKVAPSNLAEQSRRLGKALRSFGSVRNELGMTAEEMLIFLAIGHLGIVASSNEIKVKPVPYITVSGLLAIPKETVRRKSQRLRGLNLLRLTTTGLLLVDPGTWRAMVSKMGI